jgi:hypothetical protein
MPVGRIAGQVSKKRPKKCPQHKKLKDLKLENLAKKDFKEFGIFFSQ